MAQNPAGIEHGFVRWLAQQMCASPHEVVEALRLSWFVECYRRDLVGMNHRYQVWRKRRIDLVAVYKILIRAYLRNRRQQRGFHAKRGAQ